MQNNKKVQRKSMATNGSFTFAAKVAAMVVPFIVYPFIMRVLGAESYGKVTYAESLASYFSLLAVLGVTSYAQRECAVVRENTVALKKVASQVFALNIIMSSISLVIYLAIVFLVPSMQEERSLFLIFAFWIVGSGLSMEWLYTSQERFDLISIREIIAKILYLVLCFTLIKSNESYLLFGLIVVFSGTVFGMTWNITGILRGQCGVIPNLRYSSGFTHSLKPVFYLALLTIGSKLFTDFDVMMIKWFTPEKSDTAVGLYNSAILLPKALDSILMTVSAVITPQLFIATRQNEESRVKNLMNKTSNVLFFIAFPAIITCLFFSREMLWLFAGEEYVSAASVLQIYSFVIMGVLVITLAGTRTYIARKKERKLFQILILGAALNIILNYIFIKLWGINGAALATLCAYIVVMTVELSLENTWHYIFTRDKWKYVVAGALVAVVFIVVRHIVTSHPAVTLSVALIVAGIVYLIALFAMKESTLAQVYDKITNMLKK